MNIKTSFYFFEDKIIRVQPYPLAHSNRCIYDQELTEEFPDFNFSNGEFYYEQQT